MKNFIQMIVTLEINDNKARAFLDFIKVKEETDPVPTKEEVLQGVREAVEEMKLIHAGKKEARDAEDFLNEL